MRQVRIRYDEANDRLFVSHTIGEAIELVIIGPDHRQFQVIPTAIETEVSAETTNVRDINSGGLPLAPG